MLGTLALHMAASPKEVNTVRTRTTTPDWYSWGIFRPFPRSHICRKRRKIMIRTLVTQLLSQRVILPHWIATFFQCDSREKQIYPYTLPLLFSKPTLCTYHPLLPKTGNQAPLCGGCQRDHNTRYYSSKTEQIKLLLVPTTLSDQCFAKCIPSKTSSEQC